eukprot:UN05344
MKHKRKKPKRRKKKEAEPIVVLPEEPKENILLQPKEGNDGEPENKVHEGGENADVNSGKQDGEPGAPPNQDVDDEKCRRKSQSRLQWQIQRGPRQMRQILKWQRWMYD